MKTKILACILAVVTVLSVFPMTVAAATVSVTSDGFQYTTDENGATIVGYSGSDTELYIPYSIKGKKVIAIEECALQDLEDVTYIEVPPYVTDIGEDAFYGCTSLESITLPEGLSEIADNLFNSCTSLSEITLPEGIKRIGYQAFANCSALKDAYIMSTKLEKVDANTFMGCSSLDNLYFNTALKGEDGKLNVTVDATAFANAKVNADAAKFSAATQQEVTVTVNYVVPQDAPTKPAENPLVRKDKIGANYSFTSPAIEGYTPDIAVVEGIYTEDKTVTVTYTAIVEETETETDTGAVTDVADTEPDEGDKKIDVGTIIAIVIFAIVLVGIVVFAVFMIKSDKKDKNGKGGKNTKEKGKKR